MAVSKGNLTGKTYLAGIYFMGWKVRAGIEVNLPDTNVFGSGNIRIVETWNLSTTAPVSVTSSTTYYIGCPVPLVVRGEGHATFKIFKETPYGDIPLAVIERDYLDRDQYANDSATQSPFIVSLPKLIHFQGQPLSSTSLKLKYRPAGSLSAYTEVTLPKYQINGNAIDGWYAYDWSAIPSGNYDYIYEAQDANSKVLNRVSGQFRIDSANAANTTVLSQTPQNLDPQYVSQLQWIISGTQDQSSTIHNRQEHNAFGDIISETDGLGRRTDLYYNTQGKLIRKLAPETDSTNNAGLVSRVRPETRYYYDRLGRFVGTQDANGNRTTQRYAGANPQAGGDGLVMQEYHADGGSKTTGYDRFGQMRTQTDEIGRTTRSTYDKNRNLIRIDRPTRGAGEYLAGQAGYDLYNYDLYNYDSLGQRISHTNALGNTEKWTYDSLGRVTQSASFAGRTTTYTYLWNATQTSLGGVVSGGWRKTTTDANNRTQVDDDDIWGRNWSHTDLGGHVFNTSYNAAGWVMQRTGTTTGQKINYTYYDNGFVKTIQDDTLNTYTKYEYDAAGNRTFEGYTTIVGQGNREFYQYANISYDELNRVKQVWDPKYQVNYEYDAVGNRRRVKAYYHDGANGNASTQDYWYLYDSMNRFTLTKGTMSGTLGSGTIVKGTEGIELQYNAAGERKVAIYGYDGHREDYAYNADGYLATTSINSLSSAIRNNNLMGQLDNYVEYNLGSATVRTNDTNTYDADSKVSKVHNNLTAKGTNYSYLADGTLDSTTTYGDSTTTTSSYSYEWWDSAKQSQIQVQASNQAVKNWAPGYSQFQYDANGNLKQVNDNVGNRALRYVTNAEGLILKRDEIANLSVNKTHYWYYANGRKIGDVGNDGQSREDYAQALQGDKNVDRKTLYQRFKPVNTADFDQNYEPINANYPSGTPGTYTVRTGDTLRTIASSLWGDGSLWYLLADANGLSGSATLTAGTTLVVPNKVTNLHNNSTTFRPYSAGEAIGDTSPTLPDPPPPPVQSDGCGGAGTILMIVVMAVVTVYTAGAASAYFAGTAQLGFGATMAAGAGVMTGGAALSMAATVGAAMVGAAAGNIVGQGLAIAMNMQKDFSWNQVGMSALSAGVTAGLGGYLGKTTDVLELAGRAALGSGLSQGLGEQLGMGVKFSWTNVAMAAVSSGVNSAVKAYTPFTSKDVFQESLNNLASGLTMNALRGGQMTAAQVAAEALGNALGDSMVEGMQSPDQSAAETARLRRSMYEPDESAAETARLGRSMYQPDQSAAEDARLARSMYQPDQSAAEDARLGRYEVDAMDAQYVQQSDAIMERRNQTAVQTAARQAAARAAARAKLQAQRDVMLVPDSGDAPGSFGAISPGSYARTGVSESEIADLSRWMSGTYTASRNGASRARIGWGSSGPNVMSNSDLVAYVGAANSGPSNGNWAQRVWASPEVQSAKSRGVGFFISEFIDQAGDAWGGYTGYNPVNNTYYGPSEQQSATWRTVAGVGLLVVPEVAMPLRPMYGAEIGATASASKLSFDSSLNVVDKTFAIRTGEILAENPVGAASYARLQRQGTDIRFVNDSMMKELGLFEFDAKQNTVTVNMLRHSSAEEAASTIVHEATHQKGWFNGVPQNTQFTEYQAFRNEFLFMNGVRPSLSERMNIWNDVQSLYPDLPQGKFPFGGKR